MSPTTRPIPIVACLSGDGIGPEVMAEAGRVIDAASELFGIRVRQVHLPFGGDAIDKHGDPFPSHVRAAVKASDAVLLGAVGGPRWDGAARGPRQGLLGLRKELDAFANLRPVRSRRHRPDGRAGADRRPLLRQQVADRGLGQRHVPLHPRADRAGRALGVRLARRRNGRVVSVDKANVLATSKLWRRS